MYPFIYGGDAPNITGGFSANTSRYWNNKKEKELMENEKPKRDQEI